ncbi:apoptotic protease-activating factor 1 isoform X1 [Ixodes scapularis]|uniref:apoptotic protease-activating factor 1 isoform X1 n=1 Tax=Ixodes scapularis TaxID=6945 RepID=UPI001A9ED255|nr:apoptotic protease-activating factor 1 isoform X1 [Ixodes scapularis]
MTIDIELLTLLSSQNMPQDTAESVCLKQLGTDIVEDLEPKFVVSDLEKHRVLTTAEVKDILGQGSVENQSRRLLDILCLKGERGYQVFVETLDEDNKYPWLATRLRRAREGIREEYVYTRNVLQNGGVPYKPMHMVCRPDLVTVIRDALRKASRNERDRPIAVVLHGMVGCGKSVLAAEALRDPSLLRECFPDGVYWLGIGNLREPNDVLLKMHLQLDRIKLGCHNDAQSVDLAKSRLQRWALKNKALLVLDDVWSRRVVDAFTVGCPLLVTTKDISVVDQLKVERTLVEVVEGLTLPETRRLFAEVFGVSEQELPHQVDDIHNIHRGLPLLMSSIAAVLKPNFKRPEFWKPYVERALQNTRRRRSSGSDMHDTLDLILRNLDGDTEGYFRDFALFMDDVDIPSVVFEVLWNMSKEEVDEVMCHLQSQCLVRVEEDPVEGSRTYGIHDLYLSFLRKKCPSLKDLHRRFVEALLRKWHPTEIPCERGYLYWYLGYHLDEADMGEEFRRIFLDLHFVERKVKCNCPSDLTADLQRYERHFQESEAARERGDLLHFLQPNTHILSDPSTDVVQLALCQPRTSTIYPKARALARRRVSTKPYFDWTNMPDTWSQAKLRMRPPELGVLHAEFSPDDLTIATAGEDGRIRLWQSQSGIQQDVLEGHSGPVNCCTFSRDGLLLASASSDCTVRLWKLGGRLHATSAASTGARPRAASRTDARKNSRSCEAKEVVHGSAVNCCCFSPDGTLLVSGDEDGFVMVHTIVGGDLGEPLLAAVPRQEASILTCSLTCDSLYLALALSDSRVQVYEVRRDLSETRHTAPLQHWTLDHPNGVVRACCASPREPDCVLSVAGQYVCKWQRGAVKDGWAKRCYNSFTTQYHLTCCAVSPDGLLVAAGTTLRAVLLWSIKTGAVVGSFKGHAPDIRSVHFSHDGCSLVSSSSDGTVVLWNVTSHRNCSRVALVPVLDVVFADGSSERPLLATFDETGFFQVCSGLEARQESKMQLGDHDNNNSYQEVSCCCFSHDHGSVLFGTKSGSVNVFRLEEKRCETLGRHDSSVTTIISSPNCLAISGSSEGTLKVWEADGSSTALGDPLGAVVSCRLFDDARKLLSWTESGEICVWNLVGIKALLFCIVAHGGHRISSCDVSPDGRHLLSGSSDKNLCLWDSETGELQRTKELEACVRCCCFSPDAHHPLAAAGTDDGTVYVYHPNDGSVARLGCHSSFVRDLAFSPDGRQLASLSESVCWWRLDADGRTTESDRPLQKFWLRSAGAESLFVSPDFGTFVTVDDAGTLYVLRRVGGEE